MSKKSSTAYQQQMYKHIESWQQSNMSQQSYCEQSGIRFSVFQYWRKQYLRKHSDFIPVTSPPIPSTGQIEITYPNGVQLRLPSQTNIKHIAGLINLKH